MGCGDSPGPTANSTVNGVEPMLSVAQAVLAGPQKPSMKKVRDGCVIQGLNTARTEQAVGMFLLLQQQEKEKKEVRA